MFRPAAALKTPEPLMCTIAGLHQSIGLPWGAALAIKLCSSVGNVTATVGCSVLLLLVIAYIIKILAAVVDYVFDPLYRLWTCVINALWSRRYPRCVALTAKGVRCKNWGQPRFCHCHKPKSNAGPASNHDLTTPSTAPMTTSTTATEGQSR